MAEIPTVQAVKAYVEKFVDSFTKYLQAFHTWDVNFEYGAGYPCFYCGKCYYANPVNPPLKGQSPDNYPDHWFPIAGEGNSIEFGEAIKALKIYSFRTLMLTNAYTVPRRMRGWDIGFLFPSNGSEVYHFDTDFFDQNQEHNITITHQENNPPIFVGYSPAVKDEVPYEPDGKSLFGEFSIVKSFQPTNVCSVDFWIRYASPQNTIVLNFGSTGDRIVLILGGLDPAYSEPEENDPAYSEGVPEYSIPAIINNKVKHFGLNGEEEEISVDSLGTFFRPEIWFHVAAVLTADKISLFVGAEKFEFARKYSSARPVTVKINENMQEVNLDELLFDRSTAVSFDVFKENTEKRIPWAPLSHLEPWFVLEAQDIQKVKTNLFETEEFKAAVKAVINNP